MEDLWKDIQLSSLNENPATPITTRIFQDFLSSRQPQPPSLPATNGKNIHDEEEDDHSGSVITPPCFLASMNTPFEALVMASSSSSSSSSACSSSSSTCAILSKNKRVSEDQHRTDEYSGSDRRHKRMMKNRESAARSRARRQAYTSELESEVARLMEENTKLREQQEKLVLRAPAEIPKKRTHTRSLTAPF